MKKVLTAIIGLMLTMAMFSSVAVEMIPNPIVQIEAESQFKEKLGFDISKPKVISGYKLEEMSVISDQLGQYIFNKGEQSIIFRKAKGNEDMAGLFFNFDPVRIVKHQSAFITLRSVDEKLVNALWLDESGEFIYSIYVSAGTTEKSMLKMVESFK